MKGLFIILILSLIMGAAAVMRPWNFLADDSFFYQQVAHNIASGFGSTFSRVTTTNGYHPLWLVVSSGIHIAADADKTTALHAVVVLAVLLAATTTLVLGRLLDGSGLLPAGLAPISGMLLYLLTGMYGCEAHLNALAVVLLAGSCSSAIRRGSVRSWMACGLAASFAILSRLDNIFIAAAAGLAAWLASSGGRLRRPDWRSLASFALPVFVLVGTYLAYNTIEYGHPMPISGAIKTTFPLPSFQFRNIAPLGWLTGLSALAGIVFLRKRTEPILVTTRFLSLGYLLYMSYLAFFVSRGYRWSWYFVSGVILSVIVHSFLFREILARLRASGLSARVAIALPASLILVAGIARAAGRYIDGIDESAFLHPPVESRERWQYEAAAWLDGNLPGNAGVYCWDYPGMFAYYSDLRILPCDGLINNFEYQEQIVSLGVMEYLKSHDVGYYIGPSADSVTIQAFLFDRPAGTLNLTSAERLAGFRDVLENSHCPDWAVWRLF